MRNKKTIKEFRAFYIMASSVYAKWKRNDKQNIIAGKQNVIRYGIAEITGCLSTKKMAHGRIAGRIMWS